MELDFGQEAYGTQFDSFMRHYLTVKTGEIPREREVYEAFKDYAAHHARAGRGRRGAGEGHPRLRPLLLRDGAGHASRTPTLEQAFHDLRELKVDVAYPFLLELYHDYANGTLSAADFAAAVRLVEAYVFRRAICAIPTNSMNKTFATFGKALKKDRYLESIQAHFLDAALVSPLSRRRRVPARPADPRPLQLPQPQLLAAPAGEPRPQGACAGG